VLVGFSRGAILCFALAQRLAQYRNLQLHIIAVDPASDHSHISKLSESTGSSFSKTVMVKNMSECQNLLTFKIIFASKAAPQSSGNILERFVADSLSSMMPVLPSDTYVEQAFYPGYHLQAEKINYLSGEGFSPENDAALITYWGIMFKLIQLEVKVDFYRLALADSFLPSNAQSALEHAFSKSMQEIDTTTTHAMHSDNQIICQPGKPYYSYDHDVLINGQMTCGSYDEYSVKLKFSGVLNQQAMLSDPINIASQLASTVGIEALEELSPYQQLQAIADKLEISSEQLKNMEHHLGIDLADYMQTMSSSYNIDFSEQLQSVAKNFGIESYKHLDEVVRLNAKELTAITGIQFTSEDDDFARLERMMSFAQAFSLFKNELTHYFTDLTNYLNSDQSHGYPQAHAFSQGTKHVPSVPSFWQADKVMDSNGSIIKTNTFEIPASNSKAMEYKPGVISQPKVLVGYSELNDSSSFLTDTTRIKPLEFSFASINYDDEEDDNSDGNYKFSY